jgi:hypothetical protein
VFPTESPPDLTAAVVAAGSAAVRLAACGPLRKSPPTYPGVELSGHFLKHADEQTIVALLALRRATDRYGIDPRDLADWGVIAAPRYIGRLTGASVLYKFPRGGTSAVAPHIVAQCSLHSVSGAASIALGMRGPNVGVGGGQWAIGDGVAAALTLFETAQVPGVWLLLSEFNDEPQPDEEGRPLNDPTCHAVALALRPGVVGDSELALRPGAHAKSLRASYPEPTVAEIAGCIDAAHRGRAARWACWLPWGGRIELHLAAAEQSQPAGAPASGLSGDSLPNDALTKAA